MKIIFIGAGNVATHMATQLYSSGCTITQIYSRTIESAKQLADKVDAEYTNDLKNILDTADYYIFSIKDSILEEVISNITHKKGIWIHTAGSMPIGVFSNKVENYGVIYPLQTFSKQVKVEWDNIPLFIEYLNDKSQLKIQELAKRLSSNIYPLTTEQRRYVHASGVFACNFVNQMYELANQMVKKAGLPFEILLPLIDETSKKVHKTSPLEAQTGPAIRFDKNVMDKHLELIESKEVKELYRLISKSINDSHK